MDGNRDTDADTHELARPPMTRASPYRVCDVHPHDPTAFTQGLAYADGCLYESTGMYGRSTVRRVELETGRVLQQRALASDHFGEGITIWRSTLLQLTWRSGLCFVYDRASLEVCRSLSYPGEGWGLTNDGTHLIMSDGTPALRFLDPESFDEQRRLTVTDRGTPLAHLNDLQYAYGSVFANVWGRSEIARICPASGQVVGWLDLAPVSRSSESREGRRRRDVLNGIAYDPRQERLLVTGKLWPHLFALALVDDGVTNPT